MGMAADADDTVIVRSAMELGHNLGMRVVAEGVEDSFAQRALVAMGCDLLQGFYICRPVPADELDLWRNIHLETAQAMGGP